jgi:D-proline reductase (dithiol) PrdB
VGLIARVLEREGIPTVTLSSAYDISARVSPPRTAFLNFPLGNAVGHPDDAGEQRSILRAALRLLETAERPGEIVELPQRWPDQDWVAKLNAQYEAEAHIVIRQREEGEYDTDAPTGERTHYAGREASEVAGLV